MGPWGMLLMTLPQLAFTERSYADLGFLNTKNKGFLRKDVYTLCNLLNNIIKIYNIFFKEYINSYIFHKTLRENTHLELFFRIL